MLSKIKCTTPNMNAPCRKCCAVEFRALCLPVNALCCIVGIGCTIAEIRCRLLIVYIQPEKGVKQAISNKTKPFLYKNKVFSTNRWFSQQRLPNIKAPDHPIKNHKALRPAFTMGYSAPTNHMMLTSIKRVWQLHYSTIRRKSSWSNMRWQVCDGHKQMCFENERIFSSFC